ncbi:bifunctional diaminohydroxyphosphoribosylaminopyrimidine deaminase/5-amino-6-(5-phosphoribosylamino)uracil reductase RibD [Sneathiella limimaris]|uniref:bifunctional diaminohydroxyphosphoribosylaminopyrimidine deaminase/5-amino-6-(5-phosphoribosylamino)uracil reductase RibD n=1 Tax=Sneathiella limimaris TaxID=1964213 RepID=UPI0019D02BF9
MKSQTDQKKSDQDYMKLALRLAARGLGRVAPNPAVGCVLVKDGLIVGRGWTQDGGRPHAEVVALKQAGNNAKGATAYVTLEPCSHHGKSPPCAEALIKAGVKRVVAALRDPDDRVDGEGFSLLQDAGIEVLEDVLEPEALDTNLGFILNKTISRPKVSLKFATSLDGKIATKTGSSQWITGGEARRYAHLLRLKYDAVLVGIGTALADNPRLDCRLAGLNSHSPVRIVADSHLRLPLTSELVKTAKTIPLWIITAAENDQDRVEAFEDLGVRIIETDPGDSGYPDMKLALEQIAELGITRLLVEGGSHLQASLVKEGLVDQIYWFRASKLIGGDGIPAMQSIGLTEIAEAPLLDQIDSRQVGEDQVETYILRNE